MTLLNPNIQKETIFSVTEISNYLKIYVEKKFQGIKIRGEISNYKKHSSGHHYFSLKDKDAIIDAICWRGTKLTIPPEEGLEIVAYGRITTYPLRSKYQIIIEEMTPSGEGALQALLKKRFETFKNLGYFDEERKKKIPYLPKIIGIVTSPTGAVIRDILHRIKDRFPVHVIVWPVLVQGPGSVEQIVQAIQGFNKIEIERPDLLIIARGGGSLEDLWSFNEEEVLKAVYNSQIPTIAAIGHETDITLIDYVADKRAPTPTAAGEMSVPIRTELLNSLNQSVWRMNRSIMDLFKYKRAKFEANMLPKPKNVLEQKLLHLDDSSERMLLGIKKKLQHYHTIIVRSSFSKPQIKSLLLNVGMKYRELIQINNIYLEKKRHLLSNLSLIHEHTSIEKTLRRGFCIPLSDQEKLIKKDDLSHYNHINLKFFDGTIRIKSEIC